MFLFPNFSIIKEMIHYNYVSNDGFNSTGLLHDKKNILMFYKILPLCYFSLVELRSIIAQMTQ